jgi:hypothetical protein
LATEEQNKNDGKDEKIYYERRAKTKKKLLFIENPNSNK